jgi:beta-lactamase regulating signal transducer with metallopeptidase domain
MSLYRLIAGLPNWAWPLAADHLWQATLFSLVALGAAALLRRAPARARYLVWLVALTKFALPSALLFFLAAQAGVDLSSLPLGGLGPVSGTLNVSPLLSPAARTATAAARAAVPPAREDGAHGAGLTASAAPDEGGPLSGLVACLWLAGCGALALSWLRKSRALSAAVRRGRGLNEGREAEALARVRTRFGLRRGVKLVVTPAVSEPGVWGVLRPVVVLPEGVSDRLDDAELEAVFMHELSHIERWDNLAGNFQRALCCLFWFHPVVWLLDRRLLAEREEACDDVVVRRGGACEVYANGIAKVCRYCLGWEVAGLAKVTGSDIRKRVERIISRRAGQRMSAAHASVVVALLGAVLTLSLASGRAAISDPARVMNEGAATAGVDERFEDAPPSIVQAAEIGPARSDANSRRPRTEDDAARLTAQDVTGQVAPPDNTSQPDNISQPENPPQPPAEAAVTDELDESRPAFGADVNRSLPPARGAYAAQVASRITPLEELPVLHAGVVRAALVNASDVSYGDLRRFIGRYEVDPRRSENFVLDITLEGGELWLKPSHAPKRRLVRRSEADFSDSYSDYDITAVSDGRGRVVGLQLNSWGGATARKLVLPAPSLTGNVTFRLRGFGDARVVAVAGEFNNWNQSQFLFSKEGGEWVCRVNLPAGTYQYKFIVDGNWLTDPGNPKIVHDRRGIENSLLRAE